MSELQREKLKRAEDKLARSLAGALDTYDRKARIFRAETGIELADGGSCQCPPCEFLRSCRAIVGAWEDEHGKVVR